MCIFQIELTTCKWRQPYMMEYVGGLKPPRGRDSDGLARWPLCAEHRLYAHAQWLKKNLIKIIV